MRFYGEDLLAPCSTPKLEDHPLSAVCDYLPNIFTTNLHVGGCSSIRNLKTRHAVVTAIRLSPGLDQIPAELIKAGGRTIRHEIHKLINSI